MGWQEYAKPKRTQSGNALDSRSSWPQGQYGFKPLFLLEEKDPWEKKKLLAAQKSHPQRFSFSCVFLAAEPSPPFWLKRGQGVQIPSPALLIFRLFFLAAGLLPPFWLKRENGVQIPSPAPFANKLEKIGGYNGNKQVLAPE